jgi:hypothetical protein
MRSAPFAAVTALCYCTACRLSVKTCKSDELEKSARIEEHSPVVYRSFGDLENVVFRPSGLYVKSVGYVSCSEINVYVVPANCC